MITDDRIKHLLGRQRHTGSGTLSMNATQLVNYSQVASSYRKTVFDMQFRLMSNVIYSFTDSELRWLIIDSHKCAHIACASHSASSENKPGDLVIISFASGSGESFASAAYSIFRTALVICQKKVQINSETTKERKTSITQTISRVGHPNQIS